MDFESENSKECLTCEWNKTQVFLMHETIQMAIKDYAELMREHQKLKKELNKIKNTQCQTETSQQP